LSRVTIGIYAGPLPLSIRSYRPRVAKDVYLLAWGAPRAGVGFRFCVRAWDKRGNASPQSCAAIRLTRKRR
jgi:hypothetical protein